MANNILIVGSSIFITGKGSGFSMSATQSPISKFSKPVIAQISPARTSATFTRPNPVNVYNSFTRCFSIFPSRLTKLTDMFSFKCPRVKRPIAIRPVKLE